MARRTSGRFSARTYLSQFPSAPSQKMRYLTQENIDSTMTPHVLLWNSFRHRNSRLDISVSTRDI